MGKVKVSQISKVIRVLKIHRVCRRVSKVLTHKQYREAIYLLQSANVKLQSLKLENLLVELRRSAFFAIDHGDLEGSWPPTVEDLFAESGGIPEIDFKEIDVMTVRSGVFNHGSIIVRNLLSEDQIAILAMSVEKAFEARDNADRSEEQQAWYTEPEGVDIAERSWVWDGGGVLAGDSPRGLFHLIEIFEETGMIDLITNFFGQRPCLSVKKTTLRMTKPNLDSSNGWHQDGSFLGTNIRSLNVWIALTDCGIDSASMDMFPRRLPGLIPTGTEGAAFSWSVSPLAIDQVCGGGIPQHLLFKAGDAVIFDEINLHRTSTLPEMTKDRLAIESWFFPPSYHPLDQIPIFL